MTEPTTTSNPYTKALGILALLALVTGGFVLLVGVNKGYDAGALPIVGGIITGLGVTVGLFWLLANAIRWQPTTRVPVDNRPPNADAPSID